MSTAQPTTVDPALDNAIVDPRIYADPDRYHAIFRTLRGSDPIHWTMPDRYRPFWTITKHRHVAEAQRRPGLFASGGRVMLTTRDAEDRIAAANGGNPRPYRGITALNGQEHSDIRDVTRAWFLPRSIKALEEQIAVIARDSIARMAGMGGRCDFVEDIALWYPLRVILMIFGLPADKEAMMLRLSKEVNGAQDPEHQRGGSEGDHMLAVIGEMFGFFREVAADRRASPQDDLATIIANAVVAGAPIADGDVFSYYLSITVAGHDTTSASTAGGLQALIENPDQMRLLRERPELMLGAVDEMVRWTAPVKHFFRRATRDCDLGGQAIEAGDDLMMCYPSACRDEDAFEAPFAFRVDRKPNPHLAFGIGPHICIGQYLARLEMSIFFRELLAAVDSIELDGEPVQSPTLFMGGLKSMPIRFRMKS